MKHLVVHSHISLNITRLYIFWEKNVEKKTMLHLKCLLTVNSEFFVRVLLRSFVKIETLPNMEITMSFRVTDVGKLCPSHELLTS